MNNLIQIKKDRGLTNAQIGRAIGRSAATAGSIMHGSHIHTYSDEAIQRLADVLQITFERCWYAMCESANETYGTPGKQHHRASEYYVAAAENLSERLPELRERLERVTVQPRPLATVEAISYIE